MNKSIFKAYDIRGIYPNELNEKNAREIGRLFVSFLKARKVIIGRDMRLSSPNLFKNLAKGIAEQGADAIDIGQLSTDAFYFASGFLNSPGIMITASHNPAQYNGFKLCRAGAEIVQPRALIGEVTGEIGKKSLPVGRQGKIIKQNILKDFRKHILSFIDIQNLKPLKIVIDAGNGMAGKMAPLIFNPPGRRPGGAFKIIPLYFKLDGAFPNHEPNPIKPENTKEIQQKVLKEKADLGVAFDGDADRVFFINEKGERINSSLIAALLIKKILSHPFDFAQGKPKEKVVYSLTCSRIVGETIKKYGGEGIAERVGHFFIKQKMRQAGAIFGAEHSAHYYFRDNFFAESGFIVSLMILEIISAENKKISEIIREFEKYCTLEEMNIQTSDEKKKEILKLLEQKYSNGKISHFDGLTVEYDDWWFNIRPSNTEPVVRLNLEATSKELAEEKEKEIKGFLKS